MKHDSSMYPAHLALQVRDNLVPYVHACLLLGPAGQHALLGPDGLLETAKSNKAWLQQLQEYAGKATDEGIAKGWGQLFCFGTAA
jgi:hypothetical protein